MRGSTFTSESFDRSISRGTCARAEIDRRLSRPTTVPRRTTNLLSRSVRAQGQERQHARHRIGEKAKVGARQSLGKGVFVEKEGGRAAEQAQEKDRKGRVLRTDGRSEQNLRARAQTTRLRPFTDAQNPLRLRREQGVFFGVPTHEDQQGASELLSKEPRQSRHEGKRTRVGRFLFCFWFGSSARSSSRRGVVGSSASSARTILT